MHYFVLVEIGDCFAHISVVGLDVGLGDYFSPELVEEGAPIGVLQDHIGGLFFLIDVVA